MQEVTCLLRHREASLLAISSTKASQQLAAMLSQIKSCTAQSWHGWRRVYGDSSSGKDLEMDSEIDTLNSDTLNVCV